jgi:quinol monooxygenase YgiN
VAIFELLEGREDDALATFRELVAALKEGGYSRDSLHRDSKSPIYVLIRHWKSEEARQSAMEDPKVLRCWSKLASEIRTLQVYERLDDALPQQ